VASTASLSVAFPVSFVERERRGGDSPRGLAGTGVAVTAEMIALPTSFVLGRGLGDRLSS
jgi:hypothetical protein